MDWEAAADKTSVRLLIISLISCAEINRQAATSLKRRQHVEHSAQVTVAARAGG